jgi:hypothetical protein
MGIRGMRNEERGMRRGNMRGSGACGRSSYEGREVVFFNLESKEGVNQNE